VIGIELSLGFEYFELQKLSKTENIGENLDHLLKRWQRPKKKLDYLDIKSALANLSPLDSSITRSKPAEDL